MNHHFDGSKCAADDIAHKHTGMQQIGESIKDFVLLDGLSTNPASLYTMNCAIEDRTYPFQQSQYFDDLFATSLQLSLKSQLR